MTVIILIVRVISLSLSYVYLRYVEKSFTSVWKNMESIDYDLS